MTIVETESTLGGEPRLEGRRISVMQVAEMYINGGMSPENVADQLGVGLDEVHEALAYYYRHPDQMDEIRRRHRRLEKEMEEKSETPERAGR